MEHWFIGDLMDSSGSHLYVWKDPLIHWLAAHVGCCRPLTLAFCEGKQNIDRRGNCNSSVSLCEATELPCLTSGKRGFDKIH